MRTGALIGSMLARQAQKCQSARASTYRRHSNAEQAACFINLTLSLSAWELGLPVRTHGSRN